MVLDQSSGKRKRNFVTTLVRYDFTVWRYRFDAYASRTYQRQTQAVDQPGALLRTANNSLQSLVTPSVESFSNGIHHHLGIPANTSYGRPRPDQIHPLSNVCPTQVVVNSLNPPLAPTGDSIEYAGNTATSRKFPTRTSAGQVSCRGFSGDTFSGSDLDKFLRFLLSEVVGSQPPDRTGRDYYFWPSIRLEDGGVSEQSPL
ncbi:hypothetical protein HO173_003092 [Letharia columbiana]|uniref:Uncharacterized protein n=1 Tax=Letharia columbiana TaxID=112416 RepID=A0A8H6L7H0_9LECA|nr:uncharacterized protein HO173_003092 [Letharia columbiana]KAF6238587.1 hypothetical protein HO173_003092 [Letharia columbiana]